MARAASGGVSAIIDAYGRAVSSTLDRDTRFAEAQIPPALVETPWAQFGYLTLTLLIAVIAALNLAHELLKRNRNDAIESEVSERVREMRERVESALSRGQQLPL